MKIPILKCAIENQDQDCGVFDKPRPKLFFAQCNLIKRGIGDLLLHTATHNYNDPFKTQVNKQMGNTLHGPCAIEVLMLIPSLWSFVMSMLVLKH